MTALRDLPRVDLPSAHHQQVRRLLVREARTTSVRSTRLRVAVPVLAAGAVAGVVGVAAVGPSTVVRSLSDAAGLIAPSADDVTCETGAVTVDAARADDVRYLLGAPGELQLGPGGANATPACQLTADPTPVQVVADAADDGLVRSVTVLLSGSPRPEPGAVTGPVDDVIDRATASLATDGAAVAWAETSVRGVPALLVVQELPDTPTWVQVWWSEGGQDWSVTGSGLEVADVLARVESVDLAAADPLGTEGTLTGWTVRDPAPVETVWYAEYVGGPAPVEVGADPGIEGLEGRYGLQLGVGWESRPWQTRLAAGDRLVDIGGRPGLLGTHGGGGLVPQALWTTADGDQVSLEGWVPGGLDALLAAARSREAVDADDPRIVAPAPASS